MSRPTIGLALIVRDEEHTLPNLLDSVAGHIDVLAVLDTGSTDRTVEVVSEWALRTDTALVVGEYDWRDDFADARNAAEALLLGEGALQVDDEWRSPDGPPDWFMWADADDIIEGAENLRTLCERAGNADVLTFDYAYAHDANGNCVCTLRRERLVRREARGGWVGRVHECQRLQGRVAFVAPEIARWVHHKPPDAADSNERNIRILKAWDEKSPDDPRVLSYLGTEIAMQGKVAEAIPYFDRYLTLRTDWDEERAQVHRKLAICLMHSGRPSDALDTSLRALEVMPEWAETYLSLAQASYTLGKFEHAARWARRVLEIGQPSTALIVNPLDFTVAPRVVLCGALGELGQIDEAIEVARAVLAEVPDHGEVRAQLAKWEATSQRDAVAQTVCAMARLLINHDEQAKALAFLEECVPYFATDHPDVVALRSAVRERLLWLRDPAEYDRHYREGGSKPEDAVADPVAVCEQLPRAAFLLEGLREQLAESEVAA